jgi:hypothetical protein
MGVIDDPGIGMVGAGLAGVIAGATVLTGRLGFVLPGTRAGLLPGRLGLLPGTCGGLPPGTLGLLGLAVPGFVLVCAMTTGSAATHIARMPKYLIRFI